MDAFRAALATLGLSGKIVASDATSVCSSLHMADVGLESPLAKDPDYLPWLIDTCKSHDIGLIVPTTDLDLVLLAENRDLLLEQGTEVMVGSADIIRTCRNKALLWSFLKQSSLPVVKTVTIEEFKKSPFYPCFAKPAMGSGGIGALRIDNADQLQGYLNNHGDAENLVIQEFIGGAEYTIDVYRKRDGKLVSAVPRQRLAVRSGEVEKGLTVNSKFLTDLAGQVNSVLDGLWGVYCIQCRLSNSAEPLIIEINPRFGGGVPLSIAAGVNFPLYLIQETLSLELTPGAREFIDNMLMLRFDQAVFRQITQEEAFPDNHPPIFR